MALHRLTSITLGVPDVAAVGAYYTDFGLTPNANGSFATTDGAQQLTITHAERRRLVHLGVGADHPDDISRIATQLAAIDIPTTVSDDGTRVLAIEPAAGFTVEVSVAPRYQQRPPVQVLYNLPGQTNRANSRAPGILRDGPVRPRRLGHVVIGSTDRPATERFFLTGIGFKVTDTVKDHATFMRCSTDHHNVLVQSAPANFLHHTAWQVDDVDDVGRGAMAMLQDNPDRHVWGPGRHYAGSNFFWYLRDPAGNFSEYYSDLDEIVDDQVWTTEEVVGASGLYAWGPPPAPSFLMPEDVAAHIVGAHTTK
jgi:catechol 2,3-dioxygenase-like lactoylglutathione lyase family enzyme